MKLLCSARTRSRSTLSPPFVYTMAYVRFFFLAFLIVFTCKLPTYALTPEGEALLVFKAGLQDSLGVLNNWKMSDENPCRWRGVRCSPRKHVISLNLPYSRLWGPISPLVGKLVELRRLSLHDNSLYGALPIELSNCSKLRALYLQSNFLSGLIPHELGYLSSIAILDISGNALSGTIPPSLGELKRLTYLNLSMNFLIGKIPETGVLASFSNASFVGNLDLCGDQVRVVCKSELSDPSIVKDRNDSSPIASAVAPESSATYVNSLLIGAMSTMGVSFALLLVCFWGYFLYYKRRHVNEEIIKPVASTESRIKINIFHGDLPYSSRDIMKKIEMLDETNIIGSGGFGTVYKLVMDNHNVFAVKKIEKHGRHCERIFERELEILGILRHRNLVNLRGYCNANSMNLLIYDYLPNGNLESLLQAHRPPQVPALTWADRLKIASGAARGLSYLHNDCCPKIVHRDIKSSNILLDENLEAHLADFGLAKLMEGSETPVTTVLAGTFGYLAPEYMQSGIASEKTDVYSYGVLLLELISGRKPTDITFVEMGTNLAGWAEMLVKQNRLDDILDPTCGSVMRESIEAMLSLAMACTSPAPEKRPSMNKVVQMLEADTLSPCPSDFYDSSSD
ncbi:hypothetical protein GOP47_0003648 [Adiantum capillus-veneris]|uniref:Protein kinase domain-containing protein n=1 Tax=Adiantum capillus-veneris TaxID=13818 RepID=A0A9D4V6P5_ADICA|nr:hypothetical protein GOP47_0003648 [Adiantum capillus-veneris]